MVMSTFCVIVKTKWDQDKFHASSWTFSFFYISFQTRYSQKLIHKPILGGLAYCDHKMCKQLQSVWTVHFIPGGWYLPNVFYHCAYFHVTMGVCFLINTPRFMMCNYNYGHILWILDSWLTILSYAAFCLPPWFWWGGYVE